MIKTIKQIDELFDSEYYFAEHSPVHPEAEFVPAMPTDPADMEYVENMIFDKPTRQAISYARQLRHSISIDYD